MDDALIRDVKIELLRRDLTVPRLAKKLGLHRSYLSLVVYGREKASNDVYERLGRLLGKTLIRRIRHKASLTPVGSRGPVTVGGAS
jgi:transcriptional regulator with XRE-family HTH domain